MTSVPAPSPPSGSPARALTSAAVVLAGAFVYALLVGSGAVRFSSTPLILGLIAIAAGAAGIRHRVVATGLVLAGWGTAVLLVDHGVVPGDRTTPAYMLGVGAGLLVASAVAPRADRGDWLASASVVAFTAPLALYSASDMASVGRWATWSAVLVAWAAWEAFFGWRRLQTTSNPQAVTAG